MEIHKRRLTSSIHCPLTKLAGGLSKLHSADDDAVAWLTSRGCKQQQQQQSTEYHFARQLTKRSRPLPSARIAYAAAVPANLPPSATRDLL